MGKVGKRGRVGKQRGKKRGVTKRAPSVARGKESERATRPTYRVRELDPIAKCGPGTSVRRLYRIDEQRDGVVRPHLVFFDRHGWYCEHGRYCPAVRGLARNGDGKRALGRTTKR